MFTVFVALTSASVLLLGEPEGCQPKEGVHQHVPQWHVIAPFEPGTVKGGPSFPAGLNDANAVFQDNRTGLVSSLHLFVCHNPSDAAGVISTPTGAQTAPSSPADEYALLRNGTLLATTAPTVVARATVLAIPAGSGAAMDLLFDAAIPATPSDAVAFRVQVLAPPSALADEGDDAQQQTANASAASHVLGPPAAAAALITVEISPALPNGTRTGRVGGNPATSFPILASETSIAVRVLVDRSVAEFFVGGGRAVQTLRAYPKAGEDRVIIAPLASSSDVVLKSIHAYDMGCGWV